LKIPQGEEKTVDEQEVLVFKAGSQDAGQGIARLDPEIEERLNIGTGDVMEIKGRGRRTVVMAELGFPDDRNKGIIRLDGATRRNARVSIDEKVMIRKIEAEMATSITFAPTEPLLMDRSGGEKYLRRYLENRVLTIDDFIDVPVMNRKFVLKVIKHTPSATAVIVTNLTEFVISGRMVTERERIPPTEFEQLRTGLDSFLKHLPIEISDFISFWCEICQEKKEPDISSYQCHDCARFICENCHNELEQAKKTVCVRCKGKMKKKLKKDDFPFINSYDHPR
jgi:predicted nucleic acid-binding Zn ribbon protein